MRRPRDNQRSRLYKAEIAAWACYDPEPEMSWPEVECFVKKVCKKTDHGMVSIGHGQGARIAMAWSHHIRLPKWARKPSVILHELAHVFTRYNVAHGPEFAKEYADLIRRFIGPIESSIMRMAYKQYHVKFRKRKSTEERKNETLPTSSLDQSELYSIF